MYTAPQDDLHQPISGHAPIGPGYPAAGGELGYPGYPAGPIEPIGLGQHHWGADIEMGLAPPTTKAVATVDAAPTGASNVFESYKIGFDGELKKANLADPTVWSAYTFGFGFLFGIIGLVMIVVGVISMTKKRDPIVFLIAGAVVLVVGGVLALIGKYFYPYTAKELNEVTINEYLARLKRKDFGATHTQLDALQNMMREADPNVGHQFVAFNKKTQRRGMFGTINVQQPGRIHLYKIKMQKH